jgi:arylsulfatase A-like enzyme
MLSFATIVAQKPAPNIIFFLVDDMGWQDCSVPFYNEVTRQNKLFHTPNMEKLAAGGTKFTQAYANQNCTPTRVSIMTGMNVVDHHVTTWTLEKNKNSEPDALGLMQPGWNKNGFSHVAGYENSFYATALPQVLKQNGYTTIHIGKAHFGPFGTPGADPGNLGFEVNIGGTAAGHPASYYGLDSFGNSVIKKNIRAVPGLEKYWGQDIFLTEALTIEAIKEIQKAGNKSQPFFLYLAHYAVHTPIVADKRFVNRYYKMGLDSTEAKYASLVEGMDKSLGDIMQYLEEKKLADNTIIIFLSDNGGLTDVARGESRNYHNAPLRSGKTSGYEGGLRVPMIIRWPGVTAPASVCRENVMAEDLFNTIISMAGIKNAVTVQSSRGLDIFSYAGKKNKWPSRLLTWHYPHSHNGRNKDVQPFSIIREGKWKLMYFHLDSRFELYDTESDISESKNLSEKEKERILSMAKKLGTILRMHKAPMPSLMSTGKAVPYPDEIKW